MNPKREIDKYQVSLKVLLKNGQGEILALGGHPTGTMAGFYDLPGGRIDTVEFTTPFSEIIAREIREECGEVVVEIRPRPIAIGRHLIPARLTKDDKEIHVLYVLFEAELKGGDVKISDEHVSMRWLDPNLIVPEDFFVGGNLAALKMYLGK